MQFHQTSSEPDAGREVFRLSTEIRVVIADDHDLFREGLAALLGLERGIRVVGEARDGLEVLRVAQDLLADVVLMDLNMSISDGLSATRELLLATPGIGVIMLTMQHDDGLVLDALQAGARGFVLKTSPVSEVTAAIKAVASGLSLLDPELAGSMVPDARGMSARQNPEDGLTQLTRTEIKVLQQVSAGMSNKQIASKLSLAESTVKNRLSVIFAKINVPDRTQAAIFGITHGLRPHSSLPVRAQDPAQVY
jgi:DNA-binding NarL/FixJ family response regulator